MSGGRRKKRVRQNKGKFSMWRRIFEPQVHVVLRRYAGAFRGVTPPQIAVIFLIQREWDTVLSLVFE
jgi:hypothetical protein